MGCEMGWNELCKLSPFLCQKNLPDHQGVRHEKGLNLKKTNVWNACCLHSGVCFLPLSPLLLGERMDHIFSPPHFFACRKKRSLYFVCQCMILIWWFLCWLFTQCLPPIRNGMPNSINMRLTLTPSRVPQFTLVFNPRTIYMTGGRRSVMSAEIRPG